MIRLSVMGTMLIVFFPLAGIASQDAGTTTESHVDMGAGCQISVRIPKGPRNGIFVARNPLRGAINVERKPLSWRSGLDSLYFNLYCMPADEPVVTTGLAKLNPITGMWEKDLETRFGPLDKGDRKLLDKATKVRNIHAVNSTGYIAIEEDVTGDEERRQRKLYFCLFHLTKGLCGGGVVGMLREGRRGDLTPQSLKIIQSIEFLDSEPGGSDGFLQAPASALPQPATESLLGQ